MRNLTVLKLGGSAITDKTQELTPDLLTISRSADQLVKCKQPLILLHGGGSFAHPFAKQAQLRKGYSHRNQLYALTDVELYLEQLSRILRVALLQRGIPTVRINPLSCAQTRDGQVSQFFIRSFENALKLGIMPITHGDIVFDERRGFSVLSADRLAVMLGKKLGATKVLFGCDVDGVYTQNPKTSREFELIPEVTRTNVRQVTRLFENQSQGAEGDVTGGMGGKVSEAIELAKNGCETIIFNLRREGMLGKMLTQHAKHLEGDAPFTRFQAWPGNRR